MYSSFNYIIKNFTSPYIRFYIVDKRRSPILNSSNRDIGGDISDFKANVLYIYRNTNLIDLLFITEVYVINNTVIFHIILSDSEECYNYNVKEAIADIMSRLLYNYSCIAITNSDIDAIKSLYNILVDIDFDKLFSYFISENDINDTRHIILYYKKSRKKGKI